MNYKKMTVVTEPKVSAIIPGLLNRQSRATYEMDFNLWAMRRAN